MKPIILFLSLSLALLPFTSIAQDYFSVRSNDATSKKLEVINVNTGIVGQTITVTLSGTSIDGYTGMAYNPTDNKIYAVMKSGSVFKLITINRFNGQATLVTDLTDKFAGIAFSPSGVLYGVTGDGANVPTSLFTINMSTGAPTLVKTLYGGEDGETIAYNSNDGLIYRYGGLGLFQTINPSNLDTNNIANHIYLPDYAHSLCYNPSTNDFIFTAADSIYRLSTTGVLTGLSEGNGDDGIKGMIPVSIVTSVDNLENNGTQLRVFPVPAQDHISLMLNEEVNDARVSIFTMNGQLVSEYEYSGKNMQIDTEHLRAGNYIVTVNTGNNSFSATFSKE